jgi:HEAT repeat protein
MKKTLFSLSILILLTPVVIAQDTVMPAADEAAQLAAVINDPNASLYAKTLACKNAAQTATKDSVPVLAAVLLDETLSHPARIALQQIPGPEAMAALCNALADAKDGVLIGIIGTIGERQDALAVSFLEPFLANNEPQVVRATAVALGKIGSDDALVILLFKFDRFDTEARTLLVDGLLACAERLNADGKVEVATAVYFLIQEQRGLPISARTGAIRGLLLTMGGGNWEKPKETGYILDRNLDDTEDGVYLAMLHATRDLKSTELMPVLLAALPKLDADRQALLLDLLDCRGDAAARPVVLAMAKDNKSVSQAAAVRALAGLPDDEVVEFLLAAATGDNDAITDATADALTRMKADGLERKIIERLKLSKGKSCIPLIFVCRDRKIGESTPILLPLLSDADNDVRLAAIAALGNTVSGENIEVLVEHLLKPASATEFDAVKEAIRVVCFRSVDPDAVATKLAAVYGDASLQAQCALLELFGALGGKVAIDAVQTAVANPAEQIQDTATRVLGEWPDPDAAPVLLSVMRSDANDRFKTRALRGYIRIVRQMDTSNEHRFNMCMQALELAKRDEEKSLLVDALGRITTPASLAKLSEFIDQPTFMEQASLMAINVGKALKTQQPDAVTAVMEKIIAVTQNADTRRMAEDVLK